MPSKLGPHLMPNGEIKRWIDAGARVFKCDPTQLGSSTQIPPGILVIGKLDQHEDRINLTDWKAYYNQGWTPQQTATHRFNAQRNIYVGANKPRVDRYAANPRIDVWEDDNEVVPDNAAEAQWYAAYCIEMMKLYQSIGKKRANFNFAVGTPQGDIWPHLIPAIRHARDNGHYIALHEYMGYEADYGVGWKQIDGNRQPVRVWHGRKTSNGQPDESYPYGYTVLRYRWVYDTYLRPHGLHDTPLLITECGCDSVPGVTPAGVSTGTWREHKEGWAAEGKDPEQHYAAMLQWYDRRLREDSFVKGAAVFTVGSVGSWAHWDIAGTGVETHLLAYIAAERNTEDGTPAPPPPPPTPQPQPQPGTWVRGIDISHHQAAVNWAKLKASGIGFMFIRCSNGLTQDTRVADYAPAALAAGIPYGLYHYYQPHLDPIGQSSLVATLVGRFGVDLPVVVDLEETQNIPADYQLRVLRFLQDLTERLKGIGINRQPIIYTSAGYWNGTLKAPEWGRHCDLWIAAWTNANQPHVPAPWTKWTFWQHKVTDDKAEIAGYGVTSGRLDLNRWHGTAAELQAYLIPRQQGGGVPLQQTMWETGKKGQVLHRHPTFAMEATMVKDDFHPLGNEVRVVVGGVTYVTQLGGNKQGAERVYYAPEGRWSEMRWTGPPSAAPSPPKPPQPARIDLLPYLCGDGRIYIVRHPNGNEETFQTQREGNVFYQVKNSQFEALRFDDEWIWRGLDTSPGPSPSYDKQRPGHMRFYRQWEPGQQWARWCPRYMTVGQVWTGPGHQVQFYYKSDCVLSAANSGGATNKATLVAHHPSKTWNGFTVQDVIELRVAGGETMFYAKGWGLVAWSNSEGGSSAIIRTAQPGHANLVRETSRCF